MAALPRSDRDDSRRGPVSRPRTIDALDRRLIEALQENGRESFRSIAARLGVSEATIRARYARLVEDDILQVVAVTNPLGLGFDGMAMVGIKASGSPEPVADAIAAWEEADYVLVTAGQFDLLVEVVCADRRELLDLTNRMRALPGVVSTETFLYLDMVKQLYDWGTR
jgi:Lrp/AsnC family transcriptional regulator for asnA, asnC and gidA